MSRSLRRPLVVIALGVFVGLVLGAAPPQKELAKGNDDVFGHERFRVTISPAKTQVRAGEEFEVKLRVVNSSEELQSFEVYRCSWYAPLDVEQPPRELPVLALLS